MEFLAKILKNLKKKKLEVNSNVIVEEPSRQGDLQLHILIPIKSQSFDDRIVHPIQIPYTSDKIQICAVSIKLVKYFEKLAYRSRPNTSV